MKNAIYAHFHSSFSPCLKTDDELPHINVKYDYDLSAVNFFTQEVYTLLNKLDVHKAYGTDNLSLHILKQCASQLSPSLAILFSLSMKTGKVYFQPYVSHCRTIYFQSATWIYEKQIMYYSIT